MDQSYPRHITFESVPNFRDLGGYRVRDGRAVAWRRLFRSAALHSMSGPDIARLKEDIRPRAVIDLGTPREPNKQREIGLLGEMGARYHNVAFRPDSLDYLKHETELFRDATDMGELYLYRIRPPEFGKRLVDSLELIATQTNHPLVFHCRAGKDRTGVLAAMLLAAAGVIEEDIVRDYTHSAPFMPDIRDRTRNDPAIPPEAKELPGFEWEASAESMVRFLALLRREYGSVTGYLEAQGASSSLPRRLEEALLV
jgi:protein-tyrosine phosphatase